MGREWSWSRSVRRGEREKESTPPPGCMSSVLQLFDLHQILFRTTTTTAHGRTEGISLPQDRQVPSPRGVIAPRNSLEQDDATVSSASAITGEEEYGIPGGVRLVPEKRTPLAVREQEAEEGRSSHGTKATRAGNVVARLMGLDEIPAKATPRASGASYYSHEFESPPPVRSHQQRKTHHRDASRRETARRPLQPRNCNVLAVPEEGRHGTRSLPDTPRMSSARKSWDTDPRLSLQLNYKENAPSSAAKDLRCLCDAPGGYASVSLSPLFAKSKSKAFAQKMDDDRSPSRYAHEIIKQVKENITRRIAGRDCDHPVVRPKGVITAKVSEKKTTGESPKHCRSSPALSSSPRLRFPDSPKNRSVTLSMDDACILSSSPKLPSPPPPPPPPRPSSPSLPASDRELLVQVAMKLPASPVKGKKASSERFMEKLRKPPAAAAREESFVLPPSSAQPRRRCRPSVHAFVPGIRKDPPTSPTPPPQPQTHVSAPPMLRQISDQLLKCGDGDSRERSNSSASAGPEEYQYVWCILERTGVQSRTPFPFATALWYSPSHPVDPILFHQLEWSFDTSSGPLRHRCNRKLLFHLVDEVLADLLWPVLHATAWTSSSSARRQRQQKQPAIPDGEALMQRLWSQIRGYPSADCRVLQDIDSLVEADLPSANVRQLLLHPTMADESGCIASELAAAVLESLVGEAAGALVTSPWSPVEAVERRVTVA